MFGEPDLRPPFACGRRDVGVLGPNADRRRAALGRRLAADQVHHRRADEAGDEQPVRPVVELKRRADLHHRTPVEHDDFVGHGHRLDLVVGDVDHRRLERVVQFADLDPHLHAQRRVEVGERLVEQERLGLAHDRPADGDALALAAGELARLAVEIVGEVERRGGLADLACDHVGLAARHLQREADVGAHAHVRIERVGLEHHRQPALGRANIADILAVDENPPRGQILEPGDQPQQRRLAAARRPDEDGELAVLDVEIDVIDDVHRAERLAHRLQLDGAHRRLTSLSACSALFLSAVPNRATRHGGQAEPFRSATRRSKTEGSRDRRGARTNGKAAGYEHFATRAVGSRRTRGFSP